MKKKMLIYSIIIFVFTLCSFSSTQNPYPVYKSIEKAMEDKVYSYLTPVEKKYIMNYYEETGILLLTAKNKQENEPFFNPAYGAYLNYSEEEKKNIGDIPNPIITETIIHPADGGLASQYNLANLSGRSYISDLKNQGNLGLCWAFTSVEQAESYIMKRNNIPNLGSSGNSPEYSPRQLDYASTFDSLRDYENEYYAGMFQDWDLTDPAHPTPIARYRELGEGGSYMISSTLFSQGVSLFDETDLPYDDTDMTEKELQDIINYKDSNLELNSSIVYEDIGTQDENTGKYYGLESNSTELKNFINKVKQNIMEYGGVYVSTQSPQYSCSYSNGYTNDYIIRLDDSCVANAGHAMHIIGWDDTYTYSYCKNGSSHSSPNNCTSGTIVNGKGAWIVRNSWGNLSPYVHLAYDTYYESIYLGTDFTNTSERTWDNVYHGNINAEVYKIAATSTTTFTKKINTPEKLEKIKFHAFSQDATYNIRITSGSDTYNTSVSTTEKGYVTVNVSDMNIYLTDEEFDVKVTGALLSGTSSYAKHEPNTVSAFTSNVNEEPLFDDSQIYQYGYYPAGYTLKLKTNTKNMISGQALTYTLKDRYGGDYTSYITFIDYTKIAANNINTLIKISGSVPRGVYDLNANYNDGNYNKTYQIKLVLGTTPTFNSGSGTDDDPYLIRTEEQLKLMNLYKDKYYRIIDNITLTHDWVPVGTEEDPFTGSVDGQGYTISNLNVPSGYKDAGLFGYVKVIKDKYTYIRNIRLENANVVASESSGLLIGTLTGDIGYGNNIPSSTIEIIKAYMVGGSSYSYTGVAGSVIGRIIPAKTGYSAYHTYSLDAIFSSATIGGKEASGVIGEIVGTSSNEIKPTIYLEQMENVGIIDLKTLKDDGIIPTEGKHASIFGKISGYVYFTLNHYISSPLYLGFSSDRVYGTTTAYQDSYVGDGYNTLDPEVNIEYLRYEGAYDSWGGLYDYDIDIIDDIDRLPILRGANIPYTNDIEGKELELGDTITLSDDLTDDTFKRLKILYTTDDEVFNIEEIKDPDSNQAYDATLTAVKPGYVTVKVASTYDGYVKDLYFHVTGPITEFNLLNSDTVTIERGNTHFIETEIIPDATDEDKTITWNSSNTSVVTVDEYGVVTAVGNGTAIVTGTLSNDMSVSVSFTVINPIVVNKIYASKEKVLLAPGVTKTITTMLSPQPLDTIPITWTSYDTNVVTVNDNGEVTGVGVGETEIVLSIPNGVTTTIQVVISETLPTLAKGDTDINDRVDVDDVITALRKAFSYLPVDDDDYQIIDINEDGLIDVDDVVLILQYAFGYITSL